MQKKPCLSPSVAYPTCGPPSPPTLSLYARRSSPLSHEQNPRRTGLAVRRRRGGRG